MEANIFLNKTIQLSVNKSINVKIENSKNI